MVEFISNEEAETKTAETEQPLSTEEDFSENEVEASQEATLQSIQETLEELVGAHDAEVFGEQAELGYFDEIASSEGEYHAPQEFSLNDVPYVKDELVPLVYEEKEVGFAVDIFEKYGKKEDKWWRQLPGNNY